MSNPIISIVLSVYNTEKYLLECLQSIENQTYTNWELVIINDGSTDNSHSIIADFIQKLPNKVQYFNLEQNKGLPYCLNLGIQQAKGRYIARMDADDIMLSERLAVQVAFLEQHCHIDILGSGAIEIDDQQQQIIELKMPQEDAIIKKGLIGGCPILHPTIMFRTTVFDHKIFYRDLYPATEDRDLWLRLAPLVNFSNLPLPLLLKRTHPNQITMSKKAYVDTLRLTTNYLLEHGILLKNIHYLLKPLLITLLPNVFYTTSRNFKRWLRHKKKHYS